MGLSGREQRLLGSIGGELRAADARLAGLLEEFGARTAAEVMPGHERLHARRWRWLRSGGRAAASALACLGAAEDPATGLAAQAGWRDPASGDGGTAWPGPGAGRPRPDSVPPDGRARPPAAPGGSPGIG